MYKFIDLDTGLPALLNKVKTWVTSKLAAKQDALVSGTNIKTVNNESLLGGGNITIQGEKGDKGDKGDTVVIDPNMLEQFDVIDDLSTGGSTNALSAEQGVNIKTNVDIIQASLVRLYNKLGNMAFWDAQDMTDAAPTPIHWNLARVTVTLANSIGEGAVIRHNGSVVGDSIQLYSGDPLTITIEAADDNYSLTSVLASFGTVTENNGIYTITISSVTSNVTLTISGTVSLIWHTADKSLMNPKFSINAYNGKIVDGGQTVILSPKGPNDGANVYGTSAGTDPVHFHDIGSNASSVTLKYIDPNEQGTALYYCCNVAFFNADYSFIKRETYHDCTSATGYQYTYAVPANARYMKILTVRKNNGTEVSCDDYFSGLPSDFLKYKID